MITETRSKQATALFTTKKGMLILMYVCYKLIETDFGKYEFVLKFEFILKIVFKKLLFDLVLVRNILTRVFSTSWGLSTHEIDLIEWKKHLDMLENIISCICIYVCIHSI